MTKKVLFVSPYSLLDSTNGAAISMRMLLATLSSHGFECRALTGTFSPAPEDFGCAVDLSQQLARHNITRGRTSNVEGFRVLSFDLNGVKVQTFTLDEQMASQLVLQELALAAILPVIIGKTKPDLLLASMRVQPMDRIAHVGERFGVPVAAYLATAKPLDDPAPLKRVRHVFAPSLFLANYYSEKYGIDCQPLRPIVPIPSAIEPRRRGSFVTMVNPSPEKGVTLFAALAKRAFDILPDARFLIVEGRWTKARLQQNGIDVDLPNVTFESNTVDLTRIYQMTSVLLHPSYWEEGFGRTIVEAQGFGVPVLASRRGGAAEALNGAGFTFDLPERLTRDFKASPSDQDLQPWLEQLTTLLTNTETYAAASRAARHAAQKSFETNTTRAVSLFGSITR